MDNLLFKSGNNGQVNVDQVLGIVECFVAGIGNKDSVGDIVISGAFAKSLTHRKPRVVWGHSWNDPIGKVLEMYEVPVGDSRLPAKMRNAGIGGLYAKVQFNLNSEKGKEAFANVAFFGEEQEWSIGYKTIDAVFDQGLQANILKEVELYEVSPVLHGANQLTGTISIKADEKGHMPVIPMQIEGMPMMQAMNQAPRIVVIAAPDKYTDDSSIDNPFSEGMSRELSQPDKNGLQAELAERTGSKIEVINATENIVIFRRTTADGKASMYRLAYHNEGGQFMFGKPEPYEGDTPKPQPMQSIEQKPEAPVVIPNGGIAYRNDDQQEMMNLFGSSVESPFGKSEISHLIELPEAYMVSARDFMNPVLRHHKLVGRPSSKGIIIDGTLTASALDALQNAVKALGSTLGQSGGNIGQAIGKIRDLAQTFNPFALDGDGDGFVQDGSAFARPYVPIKKPGFDLPDVRGRKRDGNSLLDKPRPTSNLPKDKNTWTPAQRKEALLGGLTEPETREDIAFLANTRPENEGIAKYWDMPEADLTKEGNKLINARKQSSGAEKERIDQELLKVSHDFQRRASYAETFGQDFVPPAKREMPKPDLVPVDITENESIARMLGAPKSNIPRTDEGFASRNKKYEEMFDSLIESSDSLGPNPKWEELSEDDQIEFIKELDYDYMYDVHGDLGDDGIVDALDGGKYDDEIAEFAQDVWNTIAEEKKLTADKERRQLDQEESEDPKNIADAEEVARIEREELEEERTERFRPTMAELAMEAEADDEIDGALETYVGELPFGDDDDGFASQSTGTSWGPLAGEVGPEKRLVLETEWLDFRDLTPEEQDQIIQDGIDSIDRVAQPDIDLEAERDFIIEEYNSEARAARSDAAESLLKEVYELWDQDADADNPFQRNGNLAYAEELIKNTDYVEDLDLAKARSIVDGVKERWEKSKKNSVAEELSETEDDDSDGFASSGEPFGFASRDDDGEVKQEKLDELVEGVRTRLLEELETADPATWKPSWRNDSLPINPITGKPYRGFNAFWLMMRTSGADYKTGRYAGYNQLVARGAQVRKGEKGVTILRPQLMKKTDKDGNVKEFVKFRAATVFNIEQADGGDEALRAIPADLPEEQRIKILEATIAELGVSVKTDNMSGPHYSPTGDYVSMPDFSKGTSALDWNSTLAHETIHWTGGASRLNRPSVASYSDTKQIRAYEELVAEIGSAMFLAAHGIDAPFREDHAPYIKGWISLLTDDPDALSRAFKDATAAMNYVLEKSPNLRKLFGGTDSGKKAPEVDAPDLVGAAVNSSEGFASLHRIRTPRSEAIGGIVYDDSSRELMVGFLKGSSWDKASPEDRQKFIDSSEIALSDGNRFPSTAKIMDDAEESFNDAREIGWYVYDDVGMAEVEELAIVRSKGKHINALKKIKKARKATENDNFNFFGRDEHITDVVSSKTKGGFASRGPKEPQEGLRRHKLMPTDIREKMPELYSTEEVDIEDKVLAVKFFSPYSNWTWYGVEFDGDDTFFGYVEGFENEWGTFSLSELAGAQVNGMVPAVERDTSFSPIKFEDINGEGMPTITEDGFASSGSKKLGVEPKHTDPTWVDKTQRRILRQDTDWGSLSYDDQIDWANSFLQEFIEQNEMGHDLTDLMNGRRLNSRPDIGLMNYAESAYARMSDSHARRRAQFGERPDGESDGFASVGSRTRRLGMQPSEAVDYVSYDPDSENLFVAYKREDGRGDMYVYEGVSMDDAIALENAPSAGRAINDIKRKKNVRKATADEVVGLSKPLTGEKSQRKEIINAINDVYGNPEHGASRDMTLEINADRISVDDNSVTWESNDNTTRYTMSVSDTGKYVVSVEKLSKGGREEPDTFETTMTVHTDNRRDAIQTLIEAAKNKIADDNDESRLDRELADATRELDMAGDAPGVESVDVTYSTALDAVDYNPSTQEMRVSYKDGGTYIYEGVDRDAVESFKAAPSKGRAMNDIKRAHPYRKDGEWSGSEDEDKGIEEFDVRGSEAVEKVSYNPEKEDLMVVYAGGKGYVYSGVTREEADAIRSAPSKGRAINDVKRTHEVRQLTGEDVRFFDEKEKPAKGKINDVFLRQIFAEEEALSEKYRLDGEGMTAGDAQSLASAEMFKKYGTDSLQALRDAPLDVQESFNDPAPVAAPKMPTRKPPRGGKRVRNRNVVIAMEQGTLDEIIEAEEKGTTVDALRVAKDPGNVYTKGPRKGKQRGADTIAVRDAETGELLHSNEILLLGHQSATGRKRGYIRARSYAGRQGHSITSDEGPSLRGEGKGMTDYDKRVYGLGSDEKNRDAGLASRGISRQLQFMELDKTEDWSDIGEADQQEWIGELELDGVFESGATPKEMSDIAQDLWEQRAKDKKEFVTEQIMETLAVLRRGLQGEPDKELGAYNLDAIAFLSIEELIDNPYEADSSDYREALKLVESIKENMQYYYASRKRRNDDDGFASRGEGSGLWGSNMSLDPDDPELSDEFIEEFLTDQLSMGELELEKLEKYNNSQKDSLDESEMQDLYERYLSEDSAVNAIAVDEILSRFFGELLEDNYDSMVSANNYEPDYPDDDGFASRMAKPKYETGKRSLYGDLEGLPEVRNQPTSVNAWELLAPSTGARGSQGNYKQWNVMIVKNPSGRYDVVKEWGRLEDIDASRDSRGMGGTKYGSTQKSYVRRNVTDYEVARSFARQAVAEKLDSGSKYRLTATNDRGDRATRDMGPLGSSPDRVGATRSDGFASSYNMPEGVTRSNDPGNQRDYPDDLDISDNDVKRIIDGLEAEDLVSLNTGANTPLPDPNNDLVERWENSEITVDEVFDALYDEITDRYMDELTEKAQERYDDNDYDDSEPTYDEGFASRANARPADVQVELDKKKRLRELEQFLESVYGDGFMEDGEMDLEELIQKEMDEQGIGRREAKKFAQELQESYQEWGDLRAEVENGDDGFASSGRMAASKDQLEKLRNAITSLDTPERRAKYIRGDYPRSENTRNLDIRYAFDLFNEAVDAGDLSYNDFENLNDAQKFTAIRNVVPKLARSEDDGFASRDGRQLVLPEKYRDYGFTKDDLLDRLDDDGVDPDEAKQIANLWAFSDNVWDEYLEEAISDADGDVSRALPKAAQKAYDDYLSASADRLEDSRLDGFASMGPELQNLKSKIQGNIVNPGSRNGKRNKPIDKDVAANLANPESDAGTLVYPSTENEGDYIRVSYNPDKRTYLVESIETTRGFNRDEPPEESIINSMDADNSYDAGSLVVEFAQDYIADRNTNYGGLPNSARNPDGDTFGSFKKIIERESGYEFDDLDGEDQEEIYLAFLDGTADQGNKILERFIALSTAAGMDNSGDADGFASRMSNDGERIMQRGNRDFLSDEFSPSEYRQAMSGLDKVRKSNGKITPEEDAAIQKLGKLYKARTATTRNERDAINDVLNSVNSYASGRSDGFASRGGSNNMIVERDPRTGYITISAMVTGDRGASEENRGTRRMKVIVAGGSIAEAKRNFRNTMKEDKVSFAGESDGFASRSDLPVRGEGKPLSWDTSERSGTVSASSENDLTQYRIQQLDDGSFYVVEQGRGKGGEQRRLGEVDTIEDGKKLAQAADYARINATKAKEIVDINDVIFKYRNAIEADESTEGLMRAANSMRESIRKLTNDGKRAVRFNYKGKERIVDIDSAGYTQSKYDRAKGRLKLSGFDRNADGDREFFYGGMEQVDAEGFASSGGRRSIDEMENELREIRYSYSDDDPSTIVDAREKLIIARNKAAREIMRANGIDPSKDTNGIDRKFFYIHDVPRDEDEDDQDLLQGYEDEIEKTNELLDRFRRQRNRVYAEQNAASKAWSATEELDKDVKKYLFNPDDYDLNNKEALERAFELIDDFLDDETSEEIEDTVDGEATVIHNHLLSGSKEDEYKALRVQMNSLESDDKKNQESFNEIASGLRDILFSLKENGEDNYREKEAEYDYETPFVDDESDLMNDRFDQRTAMANDDGFASRASIGKGSKKERDALREKLYQQQANMGAGEEASMARIQRTLDRMDSEDAMDGFASIYPKDEIGLEQFINQQEMELEDYAAASKLEPMKYPRSGLESTKKRIATAKRDLARIQKNKPKPVDGDDGFASGGGDELPFQRGRGGRMGSRPNDAAYRREQALQRQKEQDERDAELADGLATAEIASNFTRLSKDDQNMYFQRALANNADSGMTTDQILNEARKLAMDDRNMAQLERQAVGMGGSSKPRKIDVSSSTALNHVAYDETNRSLDVEYRGRDGKGNGTLYTYQGIDPEIVDSIEASDSRGATMREIRDNYEFTTRKRLPDSAYEGLASRGEDYSLTWDDLTKEEKFFVAQEYFERIGGPRPGARDFDLSAAQGYYESNPDVWAFPASEDGFASRSTTKPSKAGIQNVKREHYKSDDEYKEVLELLTSLKNQDLGREIVSMDDGTGKMVPTEVFWGSRPNSKGVSASNDWMWDFAPKGEWMEIGVGESSNVSRVWVKPNSKNNYFDNEVMVMFGNGKVYKYDDIIKPNLIRLLDAGDEDGGRGSMGRSVRGITYPNGEKAEFTVVGDLGNAIAIVRGDDKDGFASGGRIRMSNGDPEMDIWVSDEGDEYYDATRDGYYPIKGVRRTSNSKGRYYPESGATYGGTGLDDDQKKEIAETLKGSTDPFIQKLLGDFEFRGRLSDKQWAILKGRADREKKKTAPKKPSGFVSNVRNGGTIAPGGRPVVSAGKDPIISPTREQIADIAGLEKIISDAKYNGQALRFNYNGKEREVFPVNTYTNPKTGKVNMVGQDAEGVQKTFTIDKMIPSEMASSTNDGFASRGSKRPKSRWSAADRQRFADGNILRSRKQQGKRRQGPASDEFDGFASTSIVEDLPDADVPYSDTPFEGGEHGPGKDISLNIMWQNYRRYSRASGRDSENERWLSPKVSVDEAAKFFGVSKDTAAKILQARDPKSPELFIDDPYLASEMGGKLGFRRYERASLLFGFEPLNYYDSEGIRAEENDIDAIIVADRARREARIAARQGRRTGKAGLTKDAVTVQDLENALRKIDPNIKLTDDDGAPLNASAMERAIKRSSISLPWSAETYRQINRSGGILSPRMVDTLIRDGLLDQSFAPSRNDLAVSEALQWPGFKDITTAKMIDALAETLGLDRDEIAKMRRTIEENLSYARQGRREKRRISNIQKQSLKLTKEKIAKLMENLGLSVADFDEWFKSASFTKK